MEWDDPTITKRADGLFVWALTYRQYGLGGLETHREASSSTFPTEQAALNDALARIQELGSEDV